MKSPGGPLPRSPHSGLLLSPLPGDLGRVPSHPSLHMGVSLWRHWSLAHPVAPPDPAPGGLWTEGRGELCRAGRGGNPTWAAASQMPVGTGFIQFWSGLPAPGKPCLGRGVSSALWGCCQPGPLPEGNHRGHWKQLPGGTHMHTHGVRTHRHGAPVTSDTHVFVHADTFRAMRDPGFTGRPGGQAAAPFMLQTGPLRKAYLQFSDQAAKLRPGRGSHGSARHQSKGNTHLPKVNEATNGTARIREKNRSRKSQTAKPPKTCQKPKLKS